MGVFSGGDEMTRRKEVRVLIQRVLEEAALTMRQVADYTGFRYQTVRQWKSGKRVPESESRLRLAEALEKHADRLRTLAAELRAVEDEPDR
jgi:transcriptional regulator with XRE-family HTH domain